MHMSNTLQAHAEMELYEKITRTEASATWKRSLEKNHLSLFVEYGTERKLALAAVDRHFKRERENKKRMAKRVKRARKAATRKLDNAEL